MELPSKYDPKETDTKWYKLQEKFFHAVPDKTKKPYTIVIPPPNVTGSLHMGHALNNVLQDILIRNRRMRGENACWIPGTDHGGIATQNVVEKLLKKEGKSRHDLGRDKFLEKMWQWRAETGDTILMQLRTLGCSCDWERTRFTMDEQCSLAVRTAFSMLYEKGLIYRGEHIVDWCPRCGTALNESEVEHEQEKGKLWYIKYPLNGGSEYITVATTRPETMLGDTAVAVNPKDKRYKDLIGKVLILPLVNREIPVVADDIVEMSFGTGAVKVTPAHDPNDWEIAKRHNLASIQVIDKLAKITPNAGLDINGQEIASAAATVAKYIGLDRYKAREQIVKDLQERGFLIKEEDYTLPITRCYRCNSATEPLVSEQWYLNTRDMADAGLKAVADGRTKFVPDSWSKPYMLWMKNLHDWCISRQIWWGHRIPAWYCPDCNREKLVVNKEQNSYSFRTGIKPDYVGVNPPEKCPKCGQKAMIQDPDVLDTWFSSALWPFSTLGWPKKNPDLEYFYPTAVLVTGHEIIYLWVARMIMMGLTLMDNIPFSDVFIHGIVRDSHGKKMSKSLGNVIDPLEITGQFGVDALRFTMAYNGIRGRDLQLGSDTFQAARNFCNKIWNASRFVMMNLGDGVKLPTSEELGARDLELADRWILSEYQALITGVNAALESYDISSAARLLYDFTWSKYCDWYLEIVKPRIYNAPETPAVNQESKDAAKAVLIFVLDGILKLLHPVMPFITEEIWQNLKQITDNSWQLAEKSLTIESWPEISAKLIAEKATGEMNLVMNVIDGIRNIRGEMRINPGKKIKALIKTSGGQKAVLAGNLDYLSALAKLDAIELGEDIRKPSGAATAVVAGIEIYIPLADILDLNKERERLEKEIDKIREEVAKVDVKLTNKEFMHKAPLAEVDRVKAKAAELLEKKTKLEENLRSIS